MDFQKCCATAYCILPRSPSRSIAHLVVAIHPPAVGVIRQGAQAGGIPPPFFQYVQAHVAQQTVYYLALQTSDRASMPRRAETPLGARCFISARNKQRLGEAVHTIYAAQSASQALSSQPVVWKGRVAQLNGCDLSGVTHEQRCLPSRSRTCSVTQNTQLWSAFPAKAAACRPLGSSPCAVGERRLVRQVRCHCA
jgi:hypothetical protein